MTDSKSPSTAGPKASLGQLENILEEYLVKKAPFQLPDNIKEIFVQFAPWLIIIMMVVALPPLLFILGLGAAVTPFAFMGGVREGSTFTISMIFVIITIVLELLALPGLFKRSKGGWNMVFYSSLVSLVESVVSLNIIGGAISAIIGWYFLFQVKDKYK
jgi:hypothetical protein